MKTENSIQTFYTWKEAYCLPYETEWSRIAKFCFLNGVSWSYVNQNAILRNYICTERGKNILHNIPDFISENNSKKVFKICPKCMEYGYQSHFHQIAGLGFCFLHKCSLISVSPEQVEASKNGTYEFMEIRVENIVRNKKLLTMLKNFITRRQEEGLLDATFIFPRYEKSGVRIGYESTKRLFQKVFLVQDNIEINGCRSIQYTSVDNIDTENEKLAKEILKSYTRYDLQCNTLNSQNKSFEEAFAYIQKLFIMKRISYQLTEDVLGWCVMKLTWDVIEKIFDGYDDWDKTVWAVNGYSQMGMAEDKIYKYAVILAYQAITGATAAKNAVCSNCRYWYRDTYKRGFGINVYEELGCYHEPFRAHDKYENRKATQYTVYPIVQDLFVDLVNQAYIMLKSGVIELNSECIDKLTPDIWRVPQYVVLYYWNRTEIYRCEPDQ